jgi:hypothetical protein
MTTYRFNSVMLIPELSPVWVGATLRKFNFCR